VTPIFVAFVAGGFAGWIAAVAVRRRLRRLERGGTLDLMGTLDDRARRRRSWP